MSYDRATSYAHWKSLITSTTGKPLSFETDRVSQPLEPTASRGRGGLTSLTSRDNHIKTRFSENRGQDSAGPDPQHHAILPSTRTFSPISPSRNGGAQRSTSSRTSPSSSVPSDTGQAGAPQQNTYLTRNTLTSPRTRPINSSAQFPISNTAGRSLSGLGAGGGGGLSVSSYSGAYSPIPQGFGPTQSPSLDIQRSSSVSSAGNSSISQSSLSKISITQVNLLLDTITVKEGTEKWEVKAEKIRRLLDSNGKEVSIQFFRRVLILNLGVIFPANQESEQGSYRLLQEGVQSIRRDFIQARYIAEAIDSGREDIFRDFDLVTLIRHFLPDSLSQSILAVAFLGCERIHLRREATSLLLENTTICLNTLTDQRTDISKFGISSLAAVISHYGADSVLPFREREQIRLAILQNLTAEHQRIQDEIMAASQSWRLPENDRALADALRKAGPKVTADRSSIEDVIASVGRDRISDAEVAHAILSMAFSVQGQSYNIQELVAVIKNSKQINWNNVIRYFDIPDLRITTENFIRIFDALLNVAADDSRFDIQKLWGDVWQNPATQVSFLRAFLFAPSKDINLERIPGFRHSLLLKQFEGLPTQSLSQITSKFKSQYASLDAIQAIVEVCLASDEMTEEVDSNTILTDLVKNHMDAFILTLFRLSRQLGTTQESFIERCFMMYLDRYNQNSNLVLEALFKQDPTFTNYLCTMCFQGDPRRTQIILERAEELGWIEIFLTAVDTPLALDLACLRHKLRDDFDLDKYLSKVISAKSQNERVQYGHTLWKYLRIKADAEFRMQRDQNAPESVPLNLSAVFILLWKLMDLMTDREFIKNAQNTCIVTYPRLCNFGTGFDNLLEKRALEKGNKLLDETDSRMSDLFGQMYRSELSIRDLVSEMRRYKTSTDPELQDLFCCIIHGLFDEYLCYSEYPVEALEKTALLFGSIIKYKLLPALPERYGLALIIDAVKDNHESSNMHQFGVEALLQISERLPEWPKSCQLLLNIQSLQNTEIIQKAREGVQSNMRGNAGTSESAEAFLGGNGTTEDNGKDDSYRPFLSVHTDLPSLDEQFRDPDEKAQEKILFVINNLSMDNMKAKLADLQEVLKSEHHQWFASYLVEQRARLEPNNQQMYYEFLAMLNNKHLMTEVLRETYASVVKMINAKSTIDSAVERSHLKSLGGWLGSLTLAQDKPVKHKNIYFVDLLLEGFDSQRLVVVIPFTCKVLVQGARSLVFKPPNPWLMEIVRLLLELYHFAELKLNLKFEIEVLCKDLSLDHKKIEPATIIRERPQQTDEELTNVSGMAEGLEGFDELALNGPMSRGVRERISPQDIMATLPNLRELLRYPQLQGEPNQQLLVRDMFTRAFEQAILEIIAPVVERSITIASISTAQLIAKDYALEIDVERYRTAARQMVKSLAGSLALVTCKEPLRMSVSNYIRKALENDRDLGEAMPSEGHIMMALNDNLDVACSFVESAAEERSIPEIDHVIEQEVEDRLRFASEHPERDFYNPNVSRWSTYIPEPYKQVVGGLNEPQRAVYEDFDRRVRGMNVGHIQNASADTTGRQIPDVLQEALAMPNLSTPADQQAIPHQSPMMQHEPRTLSTLQQPRMNGYTDGLPLHEKIAILIDDVQKASRTSTATRLKDVEKNSTIFHDVRQILIILTSSARPVADHIARQIAEKICHTFIVKPPQNPLEAELLAFLLNKLCMLSELISRDVMRWTTANEDTLLGSTNITVALTSVGLMDLARIDGVIATALKEHNEHGLQLLVELMDQTLFSEEPMALRADFANSIVALYAWLREQPDLRIAAELSTKLKARGIPQYVNVVLSDKARAKQDQMQYIFREWVALTENVAYDEVTFGRFVRDIHNDQLLNNSEDLANFLRISIGLCMECFDSEAQSYRGSLTTAFSRTDALAQLVILFLKFQGEFNGSVKKSKALYLESMLSMILLVLNHHHEMHVVTFNQRVFTRLFNSMLFEYATLRLVMDQEHPALMLCFAKILQALNPSIFSNFAYGWWSLVSHRVLVENLVGSGDEKSANAYRTLVGNAFEFLGSMAEDDCLRPHFDAFYRALTRTVFVIKNDYPDFFSDNHVYLCARIPYQAPQLRNLILTAKPPGFHDEPDPTMIGQKVERLEDMRKTPDIAADVNEPLDRVGLLSTLSTIAGKPENIEIVVNQFLDALAHSEQLPKAPHSNISLDNELYEHIVAWAVNDATSGGRRFDENSSQVQLLSKLISVASHTGRYFLAAAIADHLRYPSSHTEFSQKLFLYLWGAGTAGGPETFLLRETLFRVIVERMINARPHPWGMIVVFVELSSVPGYDLDQITGLKQQPELLQRLQVAVRGH